VAKGKQLVRVVPPAVFMVHRNWDIDAGNMYSLGALIIQLTQLYASVDCDDKYIFSLENYFLFLFLSFSS